MEELPQRSWLVGCGRDCWWTAKASAVDSLYCGACHRWKQQLELQPAPYSFSFWSMRRVGFCAGRRRDRLAWRISLQGVSYKVIIYFFFLFFCRPNSPNSAYSFCVWSNASWRWDLSLNIVNSQRPACLHLSPPPLPISICPPFLQCPVAEKSQKNEKNGPGETNGIPSDSRRRRMKPLDGITIEKGELWRNKWPRTCRVLPSPPSSTTVRIDGLSVRPCTILRWWEKELFSFLFFIFHFWGWGGRWWKRWSTRKGRKKKSRKYCWV